MMKQTLRGLAALIMLTAAAFSAVAASGPRIEVKQERYDAGSVVEGTQAEHVFNVRNAGDELLVIDKVQPS